MSVGDEASESDRGAGFIQLLDVGAEVGELWSAEDLGAMWRHLLEGPVLRQWVDEGGGGGGGGGSERGVVRGESKLGEEVALRSLFEEEGPRLDWLRLVKTRAKLMGQEESNPIPSVIVKAVYFVSIAVAGTKCDEWITSFSSEGLVEGLGWMAEQEWLDDCSRATLGRAATLAEGLR